MDGLRHLVRVVGVDDERALEVGGAAGELRVDQHAVCFLVGVLVIIMCERERVWGREGVGGGWGWCRLFGVWWSRRRIRIRPARCFFGLVCWWFICVGQSVLYLCGTERVGCLVGDC